MRKFILCIILLLPSLFSFAQNNVLTYAGNSGRESFNDIVQLSDGTFLVSGNATDLNWLPPGTPTTVLPATGINNGQGTNQIGFILRLSNNLNTILQCVHFPPNAVENIRWMKFTSLPYSPTGILYISGSTKDSKVNNGGYFIAKLNNNFVNGVPNSVVWAKSIWAEGYILENQPWDVGSDGKVVYMLGQTHAADWSQVGRLKADGTDDIVPNWRIHWNAMGNEYRGRLAHYTGSSPIERSAIVLKKDGRCELRSWTTAEYNQWMPDGNGGMRKGAWPLDFLFNSPCDSANPNSTKSGPGYNKYKPSTSQVYGGSAVAIDRRTNNMYIGFNTKSVLHNPGGTDQPDFEPVVMAMDTSGSMLWWSRLYHEVTPAGDTSRSTPDQYVDGLAIDYSMNNLVVQARCHGNNVVNFWRGNQIASNPSASGFQNQFTGTNSNIHISWLGKLSLANGTLQSSSYVAEYNNTTTGLGTPHPDPNLDGWPNPNSGWPNVNDTRIAKNAIRVSTNGSVIVSGTGRRTITTANAHQKMVKQLNPSTANSSAWNQFVRLYSPNLDSLKYSSLIVGAWDTISGSGGDNIVVLSAYKSTLGIVAVGYSKANASNVALGNNIPVANIPSWGSPTPDGQSAVLAYYKASNINSPYDSLYNFSNAPLSANFEFVGFAQGANNVLQWGNSLEADAAYYNIEKSNDGKYFYTIATVPADENIFKHTYIDKAVSEQDNYYRIITHYKSGTSAISNVVVIYQSNLGDIHLVPNPAIHTVSVVGLKNENTLAEIIGLDGILVKSQMLNSSNSSIEIASLPTGMYIVRLKNSGEVITLPLVKK